MMATEQDLETGKEEEEVSRDLPNRGRVMIPGKEATDQLLMEEPKETLLVEVIVGDILGEGINSSVDSSEQRCVDKGEAFNQGIAIAWEIIEERLVTV